MSGGPHVIGQCIVGSISLLLTTFKSGDGNILLQRADLSDEREFGLSYRSHERFYRIVALVMSLNVMRSDKVVIVAEHLACTDLTLDVLL
jgi:hypothetical protein